MHKLLQTGRHAQRSYASAAPGMPSTSALAVFDRQTKHAQRVRSVRDPVLSRQTDYVKDAVAENMIDRLLDIKRRYPKVVDFGSGAGHLAKFLDPDITQSVLMVDTCRPLLERDRSVEYALPVERLLIEDIERLPFEPNSLDVVMSSLALHWVNDLPGVLFQLQRALRPDGVLIASLLGGDTLFELRTSLQLAEMEREGGLSPHISPMTDSRSMSNLLSRANFALPAVDVDEIVINYPSIFELVHDLQLMGENNAVVNRRNFLKRDTLLAAGAIYKELHGNEDGTIPATWQVIYGIGWKPSPTQPKPLERGSAKQSLKDIL
ncbi:uncharacterized protein L969DRAFT_87517 [Mixia osmundae IAM 14324]|uniref:Methyltransferase type 11 domain-containing protein n=1 Tax=Mixia osmundae (strain CBS 9802 / IAM 14324 / JCM 22182 / KY 12970) TaxID=764103 RepID=G7DVZ5_MIXOS|nr:uncharacterized protein L969DRAFT_87517 [Mixia osmundae IAM 14324]KEI39563.1 hypothetical protein L969DRAFT_87517 [Mixia osmundae IAM 14324]GAA94755.1 hypothetical protein E5Q_01409 [Mixia osmundae IAM 14324]